MLAAVAHGLSNAEICAALHMSLSTAKTHISHLLMKLDARDRTQLVVLAYEAGFAVPGNPWLEALGHRRIPRPPHPSAARSTRCVHSRGSGRTGC